MAGEQEEKNKEIPEKCMIMRRENETLLSLQHKIPQPNYLPPDNCADVAQAMGQTV